MVRYWSRQEKSRKWASPSYRATQRRNSRSGRKAINCEKTVRPWFMNHCPPPQNGILKPVAVQIAARHKSRQTADWQGLVRLRKVLYRTLVILNKLYDVCLAVTVEIANERYRSVSIGLREIERY